LLLHDQSLVMHACHAGEVRPKTRGVANTLMITFLSDVWLFFDHLPF